MRLYRNSSQLAHRHIADAMPSAVGSRAAHGEPPRVTLPLGYSGPLTNFYARLTPMEARQLATKLLIEADRAEGLGIAI